MDNEFPEPRFVFHLDGVGWLSLDLSAGATSLRLTASYLGDALKDLLLAAGELMAGAAWAGCTWYEEPGEFRWEFFALSGDDVPLRINGYEFGDLDSDHHHLDDSLNGLIFAETASLTAWVSAIAAGALALLDEYGLDGYEKKWDMHPFPIKELRGLQQQLTDHP